MDSEGSSKNKNKKEGESKRKADAYKEVMAITKEICDDDDDDVKLHGRDRSGHVGPFERKCDRCGAYFDNQIA